MHQPEFMTLKILNLSLMTGIMSLLSVTVFIVILMISTVKPEAKEQTQMAASNVQNFKEFVTNMITEQSSKIQTLLNKIQTNAQSVLAKIESMKQVSKANVNEKKYTDILKKYSLLEGQVESPIEQNIVTDSRDAAEAKSFSNYVTTGYGASGNANYGTHLQTYHHHSIGFDPINIVVSVSLISFLLQAIQGLLNRTRLPTPVIEARSMNPVKTWLKKFDENKISNVEYSKSKYPKKYYL